MTKRSAAYLRHSSSSFSAVSYPTAQPSGTCRTTRSRHCSPGRSSPSIAAATASYAQAECSGFSSRSGVPRSRSLPKVRTRLPLLIGFTHCVGGSPFRSRYVSFSRQPRSARREQDSTLSLVTLKPRQIQPAMSLCACSPTASVQGSARCSRA